MRKFALTLAVLSATLAISCSARDFLTRRLAADLIASSTAFQTAEQISIHTGILSSKDYPAPAYLTLQHHGWITATNANCPPQLAPPPCWDVVLTPAGVEAIRPLLSAADIDKPAFTFPAARRQVLEITGISKQGNTADVEFTWHWIALNEVGAAFYSSDPHFRSTAGFREFDDGWRVIQTTPHSGQSLEDALKNAEPVQ